MRTFELPVTVSNSHVHLCRDHAVTLFGAEDAGPTSDIGHPTSAKTTRAVDVVGPKGVLPGLRVLAPWSRETWVELNRTHAFQIGVRPPLGEGSLEGAELVLRTAIGEVRVQENVILEQRHIEVGPAFAARQGLRNGMVLSVEVDGARALVFRNVGVRVVENARPGFEGHLELDRDEANAALLSRGDPVRVIVA